MASIFSKIISGEIPAHKIAEDDKYLAFLDIMPIAIGHVLVIPKKETDYIFDMESDDYLGLMSFAKEIAKKLKRAIPCKKIGIAVVGLEVPHVHIHLIPINAVGDINFSNPKLKLSDNEFKNLVEKITTA